jgi:hypothetical protein
VLVGEGDGVAHGLHPPDSCLDDRDEDAEYEKDEQNTCKLLRQRDLMHHIVIGLEDNIEGVFLEVSIVERLYLTKDTSEISRVI